MKNIYCDYAAATPLDDRVMEAMQPYFSKMFYNPSAIYLAAKPAKEALNQARSNIAQMLGARPGEIIFTTGGTESNNLAISGIMTNYPHSEVLVSSIEHDSVLRCAQRYNYREIPSNSKGIITAAAVATAISDKTVLVSVMLANSEVGSLQPIKDIAEVLAEARKQRHSQGNDLPLYLHTDACQAAGVMELNVHRLGVDLLTFNGAKIYGPKPSAVLYIKAGIKLQPLIVGGGQEFGLRSGTENVAAAVGLAEAYKIAQHSKNQENKRLSDLRDKFINNVQELIPDARLNGPTKNRLPNNVHFSFAGQDNERLIFALDEFGISCSAGSACSASNEEASHVLMAMGLNELEARSSLRFTFGRQTEADDLRFVAEKLAEIINI